MNEIETKKECVESFPAPPQIEEKREPKTLTLTPQLYKKLERYARLCRREAKMKEIKDEIKNEVVAFCESHPATLNYGQERIAKLLEKYHSYFDMKGLEAENPELAAKYKRQTLYLELRVS